MAFTSGKKLGPYEIVSALGAGRMGEVYRAHDTRLGSTVVRCRVTSFNVATDMVRPMRFTKIEGSTAPR